MQQHSAWCINCSIIAITDWRRDAGGWGVGHQQTLIVHLEPPNQLLICIHEKTLQFSISVLLHITPSNMCNFTKSVTVT